MTNRLSNMTRVLVSTSLVGGAAAVSLAGIETAAPGPAAAASCPTPKADTWTGTWKATIGSSSGTWTAPLTFTPSGGGDYSVGGSATVDEGGRPIYGGAVSGSLVCTQWEFGLVGQAVSFQGVMKPSGRAAKGTFQAGFPGKWSGRA